MKMPLLIKYTYVIAIAFAAILMLPTTGCDPDSMDPQPTDPNVVPTPENLDEDRTVVSPPTLQQPIYACAKTVRVKNYKIGADIAIYVNGSLVHTETNIGPGSPPINVGNEFNLGEEVYAIQVDNGQPSDPSNTVQVSDFTEDYPAGLPRPRISRSPLLECGRAIGIADAVPGATVRAFAENPASGGGFEPPVQIGEVADFGYLFCTSLKEGARVWLDMYLCTDTSDRSAVKIVQAEPASIPAPSLDPIPIAGAEIVVFWGAGGHPSELLNGADLDIDEGGVNVGGQPTPGGGQQVRVNPVIDDSKTYEISQKLCNPSTTTSVNPKPCSELAAPTIYPPQPGDTQIDLISYYPGANILVFANGTEIGDSGPSTINLTRPINPGETIVVVQKLGNCMSSTAFQVRVDCPEGMDCSGSNWPAFRQSASREANQPHTTVLANAHKVKKLVVADQWSPGSMPRGFIASPVVYKDKVYIGGTNGRLYALRASDLGYLWEYPSPGQPGLFSHYTHNPSSYGIASSATIGVIQRGELELVIFAAPDSSFGTKNGSGRLFALNANTGALVWASDELAVLDGVSVGSYDELHEQIGYSSPLVYRDKVYVGIANHADNPIQKGKVKAVDLGTGNLVAGFSFSAAGGGATGPNGRGGGVWSSVAGGYSGGVFFTTGNTRTGSQTAIPSPNHGLSLIRLDENTGNMHWKLQPVAYGLDADPDWAAGAIATQTPCGEMIVSTMKDGYAYGVSAATSTSGGHVPGQWQFPINGSYDGSTGHYFNCPTSFCPDSDHGDIRYLVPGAAWKGTYITMTGGHEVTEDVDRGFNRLHSLNSCSGGVRWLKDIPNTTNLAPYQLGPPTVSKGIIYVGTAQGRLIAIADPAVYPTAISRCSHPGFSVEDCEANGYSIIADPIILYNEPLERGSMIRNEPVIANDRIYVSTTSGWVLMLRPEDEI